MPRKYHRPPTAKRRKSKKSTVPYVLEQPPEPDNGAAPAIDEEQEEELATPAASAVRVREESRAAPGRTGGAAPSKHVSRDYSYVRGEILRIVAVAGFLVVALVITSILRG